MGRKKLYHERMIAALAKGTFRRINKVLNKQEDRTEFVREAIETLIQLRESEGVKPADA